MKSELCSCGDALVTRDEIARAICWQCAGLSNRLSLLDSELADLVRASQLPYMSQALPLAS